MDEIKIFQISIDKINTVWNSVEEGISNVLDMYDSVMTLEQIKQKLLDNKFWLIVVLKESKLIASLICSCEQYHNRKVLFVHIGFGVLFDEWKMPVIEFLKLGARKIGATEIEWRGRPGFAKAYRDIGKIKHVSITVPVETVYG